MAMTQSFAMSGWAIVLQISTFIFWGIVSISYIIHQ
jgi:archaellum component FlaF (FlaF/FlaG flagellin family)